MAGRRNKVCTKFIQYRLSELRRYTRNTIMFATVHKVQAISAERIYERQNTHVRGGSEGVGGNVQGYTIHMTMYSFTENVGLTPLRPHHPESPFL